MPSEVNLLALLDEFVDGELIVAGHRGNLATHSFAGTDEEREDELGRMKSRLADQRAHGFAGAQTAGDGEVGGRKGIV